MVKTIEQAVKIQNRRLRSGLRGYAKAVRRFLIASHKDEYQSKKASIPAWWGSK